MIRFPTNTTHFHCQKASAMRDRSGLFAELSPCNPVRKPQPSEANKARARVVPSSRPEKLNVRSGCGSERLSGSAFVPSPEGEAYSLLRYGGDPAAGSPTATLLRLRPSHCARLRRLGPLRVPAPTSGAHSFHGVTGGVYKARERIHRGVADPRLLAIPASCSRVADCNPN